jgi:hypothetical protein
MSDTNKQPGLLEKISNVSRDMGNLQKEGNNAFHRYRYVKGEDAMSTFRVHEVANRIKVFPKIDFATLTMSQVTTKGGGTECLCTAIVNFEICDLDSPEKIVVPIPAQGADAMDKAIYKLMTGAFKYFILQVFSSSGDDPEEGKAEKHRSAPPPPKVMETRADALEAHVQSYVQGPDTVGFDVTDKFQKIFKIIPGRVLTAEYLKSKGFIPGKTGIAMYAPFSVALELEIRGHLAKSGPTPERSKPVLPQKQQVVIDTMPPDIDESYIQPDLDDDAPTIAPKMPVVSDKEKLELLDKIEKTKQAQTKESSK